MTVLIGLLLLELYQNQKIQEKDYSTVVSTTWNSLPFY